MLRTRIREWACLTRYNRRRRQTSRDRRIESLESRCLLTTLSIVAPNAGTYFAFDSSPTSWVGRGYTDYRVAPADDWNFEANRNHDEGVSFRIRDNDPNAPTSNYYWDLDFAAPGNAVIVPGFYDDIARYPFQGPNQPGQTLSGNHRGNNRNGGFFEVFETKYASDGTVENFSANFTQHGEENPNNWVVGEIRYMADEVINEGDGGSATTLTLSRDGDTSAPLSVSLLSDDTSEATVPASITIPAGQTSVLVPVQAIDDSIKDGVQLVTITASAPGATSGTVDLRVGDNEGGPGLILSLDDSSIAENAGANATNLNIMREGSTANAVTIDLTSSDTGEATVPATVTIPAGQSTVSVPVTAVNDDIVDGDQPVTFGATGGGLVDGSVSLTVTDQTTPTLTVEIEEATAWFAFDSSPTSWVGQGFTDYFISPFDDWTITATLNDDNSVHFNMDTNDPDAPENDRWWDLFFLAPNYALLTPGFYDDTARYPFQDENQPGLTLRGNGRGNNKNGGFFEVFAVEFDADGNVEVFSADFTQYGEENQANWIHGQIRYMADPIGPVLENAGAGASRLRITRNTDIASAEVVTLTSSDTTEATVPATVTIPAGQESVVVPIAAVDDALIDGRQTVTITASKTGFTSGSDTIDVLDDESRQISVVESDGSTEVAESGSTDTFTVALGEAPNSNVVLLVDSNDTSEATVDTASLTFTPGNWNVAQTVEVTGIDDDTADGDQTTSVVIRVDDANSDDAFDNAQDITVTVVTLDDEEAGFTVTESDGDTTVTEAGSADTFTVVLDNAPATTVRLEVTSADLGEATVAPGSLLFGPDNWDTPQTVVVRGIDDAAVDGDQSTAVTISVNDDSSDDAFDNLDDQTVTVTTVDDDASGFTVTETSGFTAVSESGATDTFSVELDAAPASPVVVSILSHDESEVTVQPTALTFTTGNWNAPQDVTVTGQYDDGIDGDRNVGITVEVVDDLSDDAFDPAAPQTITAVNRDIPAVNARDDDFPVQINTPTPLDVLNNDLFPHTAGVTTIDAVVNGTAELMEDGQILFTPSTSHTGSASLDYTISPTQAKQLGDDAGAGDEYGHALALDGNLALVGVPNDDSEAANAGLVYVLRRTDGVWEEIARIAAPDAAANDRFGFSVGISGDTVVVGARMDDDTGTNSGSVYVFVRTPGTDTFSFVTKINDPNGRAKDQFGHAVAIEDSTIVVGSRLDDGGGTNSGSVFVFEFDGAQSTLVKKIKPNTLRGGDQFGFSVAISGDRVLVGARKADAGSTDSGAAYLFERNNGGTNAFGQLAMLVPEQSKANGWFGHAVSIKGFIAVVGEPVRNGRARTGSAAVFEENAGGTGNWGLAATLRAPDEAPANQFGYGVGVDASRDVVIGARRDAISNANGGAVYVARNGSGWNLTRTILPADPANGDYFGQTVAVSERTLITASPRDDDAGSRSGSIYVDSLATDTASVDITVNEPLLLSGAGTGTGTAITVETLQPLVDAAVDQWTATGLTTAQLAALRSVQLTVTDLFGAQIGGAAEGRIFIDVNAGGRGWFVDTTPWDTSEVISDGRVDLLTVVAHELGHIVGRRDQYTPDATNDIMFGYLSAGERRQVATETPTVSGLDAFFGRKVHDELVFPHQ